MTTASNRHPLAGTSRIAELARAYPRRPAWLLAGLVVGAAAWHVALPGLFYRNSAVFLEGPLPAIAGAAVALWLHRADRPTMAALAACGWGMLATVAVLVLLGLPLFGVGAALGGLLTLVRNALRIPFGNVAGPYALWLLWMSCKAVMSWAALAYLVLMLRRHGPAGFAGLFTGWREQRAFASGQRDQARDFRRLYVEAQRTGGPLPAVPAGLMPSGGDRRGTDLVRWTYWLVRIGIALTGAGGLYVLFSEDLLGQIVGAAFRGWFR